MTKIIAEIGINHQGNVQRAKAMAASALECGADIAKFQLYRPALILGYKHPAFKEASQAQLTKKEHVELKAFCDEIGIEYCVSLFHFNDVDFTEKLGVKRYKVAARSTRDYNLLSSINKTKKPVIGSFNTFDKRRIEKFLDALEDCHVTLCYATDSYPTPIYDVAMGIMESFRAFKVPVGFSSHCPLLAPSLMAAAKGAAVLENHVCETRTQEGVDISSSLEFTEYRHMVSLIRSMGRTR